MPQLAATAVAGASDSGGGKAVARHLGTLLRDPQHADIALKFSDGVELRAHKAVLAARCPVFKTMFQSQFQEKDDKVIAIDFFNQFDRDALLEGPAAMRYRKAVLDKGGSAPGRSIVQAFLGRDESMEAFEEWIGEALAAV